MIHLDLVKIQDLNLVGVGWGLRFCVSHKFPASAPGVWKIFLRKERRVGRWETGAQRS